jgi:hypothetical protein
VGVQLKDEEEKESLYFGSVFHQAQEAWWNYFKPLESDNGNCTNSASNSGAEWSAATELPIGGVIR